MIDDSVHDILLCTARRFCFAFGLEPLHRSRHTVVVACSGAQRYALVQAKQTLNFSDIALHVVCYFGGGWRTILLLTKMPRRA